MKKYLLSLLPLLLLVIIYLNGFSSKDDSADFQPIPENVGNDTRSIDPDYQQSKKQKIITKKLACDRELQKKLLMKSMRLWGDLRQQLLNEHIKTELIQIAKIQTPPHQGSLLSIEKPLRKQLDPDYYKKSLKSSRLLNDLVQSVLSTGFENTLKKIEKETIPLDILQYSNNNSDSFLAFIYELSILTQGEKTLPTSTQIERLVNYGYQITEKDYVLMTKREVDSDFLQAIISIGPDPESLNRQYDEIPIDVAAKRGSRRLVDFWMQNGFIFPANVKQKFFSDTLLLNSVNTEEFLKNWDLLKQNNYQIRDPDTAKKILSRKFLTLPKEVKNWLKSRSQAPYPKFNLTEDEIFVVDKIRKSISRINNQINIILQPVKNCEVLDKKLKSNLNKTDVNIKKLVENGESKHSIVIKLSKIDPFLVDKFKKDILNDKYTPFIKPNNSQLESQLVSSFLRVFSIVSSNDLEEIKTRISKNSLSNLDNMVFISNATERIPDYLIDEIKEKITALPPQSYTMANWIKAEFLESHNIDPLSLNDVDKFDKNLFYYATKNNQPELMRWLAEHESNLVSDKYGSDPMDMALKWNTHPETLKTLCDLNFPLKQKHKAKFLEIQQNDAEEAEEILQNCPMFAEQ